MHQKNTQILHKTKGTFIAYFIIKQNETNTQQYTLYIGYGIAFSTRYCTSPNRFDWQYFHHHKLYRICSMFVYIHFPTANYIKWNKVRSSIRLRFFGFIGTHKNNCITFFMVVFLGIIIDIAKLAHSVHISWVNLGHFLDKAVSTLNQHIATNI